MKTVVTRKRLGWTVLLGACALNVVAYWHARAFTHFSLDGERTPAPQSLSFTQKVHVLVSGVDLPRPENARTPNDFGLKYQRCVFRGAHGLPIEGWFVPHPSARGTVVLFHGHAASKASELREAKVFHGLGMNALLVDFYGSGGSGGNETSIGFYESIDVAKAFGYARRVQGAGPIVLYGASMGAAATLKGVADARLAPAGLILECPFSSLLSTVRHRFGTMGLPSFPMADLLVFWGGVQEGFNAVAYRPIDSAAAIDRPVLLMNGDRDPWARPGEARAIYAVLKGPKTLKFFEGVGHESCLRRRPDEWKDAVSRFLDDVLGVPRSATPVAGSERAKRKPSVQDPNDGLL